MVFVAMNETASELEFYRESVRKHPMSKYIHKVEDVNVRGKLTSVAITFAVPEGQFYHFYRTLTGVSSCCPEDKFDAHLGRLVAMYDCLQRAKSLIKIKVKPKFKHKKWVPLR